jgi:large subunit ribosomal protein L25
MEEDQIIRMSKRSRKVHDITLKLDERTVIGKKAAKLRSQGFVPSIVYGGKADPIPTQSPQVETTKVAQTAGRHSPVSLTIDGKKKLAIIKTIDIDPVKHSVRHIAFQTIKQNETIETEVPIVLVGNGESEAEKAGLVVLQALEKLQVKAKPANLPESIEISIKDLATTDDKIAVGDLKLPEGVEFADAEQDTDLVIANVYEPGALQAANEAAAGTGEDAGEVASENGEDTPQDTQAEETMPGGKKQDEPKQANVDANPRTMMRGLLYSSINPPDCRDHSWLYIPLFFNSSSCVPVSMIRPSSITMIRSIF